MVGCPHFPNPRCLCYRLATLLLAFSTASAQLRGLATDETGSRVFFASALRQHGTTQPFYGKIFAFDSAGLWLFEVREYMSRGYISNGYDLISISVSGDSQVTASNGNAHCVGSVGSTCILANKSFSEIRGPGFLTYENGYSQVSSNGRWALTCCQSGMGSRNVYRKSLPPDSLPHVGLASYASQYVNPVAPGGRWIAGDGTALVSRFPEGRVLVGPAGLLRSLPFLELKWADLSANGAQVAVELPDGRMNIIGAAGGLPRDLGPGRRPALSRNASVMIFLDSAGLLNFCHTAACAPRALTSEPVAEAVLSLDGRVAYALTARGRLLRLDTLTGAQIQYLDEAPVISSPIHAAVPGSALLLAGRFPAPETARLSIGARELPPAFASPSELRFLLPWDAPLTRDPVDLRFGDSPWVLSAASSVAEFAPQLLAIAHHGFRGLVTAADPARPGELLHLYLTGLGPLSPDGLCTLSWRASLSIASQPEMLYLGLAPGFPGFYQLDLRLPVSLDPKPFLTLFLPERSFGLGPIPSTPSP